LKKCAICVKQVAAATYVAECHRNTLGIKLGRILTHPSAFIPSSPHRPLKSSTAIHWENPSSEPRFCDVEMDGIQSCEHPNLIFSNLAPLYPAGSAVPQGAVRVSVTAPATEAEAFALHTDQRAAERREFDQLMADKIKAAQKEREDRERQRKVSAGRSCWRKYTLDGQTLHKMTHICCFQKFVICPSERIVHCSSAPKEGQENEGGGLGGIRPARRQLNLVCQSRLGSRSNSGTGFSLDFRWHNPFPYRVSDGAGMYCRWTAN
jgi:hypothetical protein